MGIDRTSEETSDLRNYLGILWRRRWIIALVVWLVPLAALSLALRQPAQYRASADVLLSQDNLAEKLRVFNDTATSQNEVRAVATAATLARVPQIAASTLRQSGIRGRSAEDFLKKSSVVPSKDSNILTMQVDDHRPDLAVRLATNYAAQYVRWQAALDTNALHRALRETETRIRQLEAAGDKTSDLHTQLSTKADQLATAQALQESQATLVRPAITAKQIAPTPVKNTLLGIALGLVLGIGLALAREALDTRVRVGDELADRLALPLLGRIPAPPKDLRDGRLVMSARPNSPHAEAFRVLRTNLELMNLERRAQVIMVTSAIEGEGKSTTAANLALALVRPERRVILVDLDLRRPTLSRAFGLGAGVGLTDVTLGEADLEAAITSVPAPADGGTLDVLPAGTLHPHPGEFIGTPALGFVLEDLRAQYDLIVIDAPPVLRVGDGLAVSSRVDALLVVARLKVVRRPMLTELRRALQASPAPALGLVVTGAEDDTSYGYGRYGYTPEARATAERTA